MVPPSLEDSRTDQANQRDHLGGHENTEQDAPELEVRKSRQQPPTNGIEQKHYADDGENEAHAKKLTASGQLSHRGCTWTRSSDGEGYRTHKTLAALIEPRVAVQRQ